MKGKEENHEKDEAELFCTSLLPVLRDMDKKQLRLAKLKIQQLLYDLQYADNQKKFLCISIRTNRNCKIFFSLSRVLFESLCLEVTSLE